MSWSECCGCAMAFYAACMQMRSFGVMSSPDININAFLMI